MVEGVIQKLNNWRLIEPSFNGQTELDILFDIQRFKPRVAPDHVVQSREPDELDIKLTGFLKGKKVFLTE